MIGLFYVLFLILTLILIMAVKNREEIKFCQRRQRRQEFDGILKRDEILNTHLTLVPTTGARGQAATSPSAPASQTTSTAPVASAGAGFLDASARRPYQILEGPL